MHTYLELMSHF